MLRYTYIACLVIYDYQPHNYWLFISDLMKLLTEESDRQTGRRTDKRTDMVCVCVCVCVCRCALHTITYHVESKQLVGHMLKTPKVRTS